MKPEEEIEAMVKDAMINGTGFMKDGNRVSPREIYKICDFEHEKELSSVKQERDRYRAALEEIAEEYLDPSVPAGIARKALKGDANK